MLELITNWLSAAIGAGLVVALIDWFRTARRDKAERRVAQLSEQIQHLYGPIYYLVTLNKAFFDLSRDVQKAGSRVFSGKTWSSSSQPVITKMIDETIQVSNQYIQMVVENNEKIMAILDSNIHLATIDDVGNITAFVRDYYRLKVETTTTMRNAERKEEPHLPLQVVLELPRISFLDPKFIAFIERRYAEIKKAFRGHL